MKIGVIGLGFVGLTLATALASKDYEVIGLDIDAEKLRLISRGKSPFYEEGLEELLKSVVSNLRVTDDYSKLKDVDIVFVCVGTPPRKDGSQDQRYIMSAIENLSRVWNKKDGFKTVVVKSTVIPGTTRKLANMFSKYTGLVLGTDFGFVSNPEFLREGKALHDLFYPHRVVIGCVDEQSCSIVKGLWENFYRRVGRVPPILVMSSEEAELVKYASNAFLAMRISYANTIANICEATANCDVLRVLEAAGLDPRIGKDYLRPGLGYGGSCLPKDVKALITYSKSKGLDPLLLEAVDRINEKQPLKAVGYLLNEYGDLHGRIITVLGLAFKPGTSDIRESVALKIIRKLLELGADIRVHDPMAMENAKKIFGDKITYYSDPRDALRGSDGVIIATEWDEYRKLTPKIYKEYMRNPVVIDGRRIYDPIEFLKAGVRFYAIGFHVEKTKISHLLL